MVGIEHKVWCDRGTNLYRFKLARGEASPRDFLHTHQSIHAPITPNFPSGFSGEIVGDYDEK